MLTIPILLLVLLRLVRSSEAACIEEGTSEVLNHMLSNGGPGALLSLCPNAVFTIDAPLVFTAKDQEISTEGYPDGVGRATIIVAGNSTATAIHGDCKRCSGVRIRNIIIDGNRRQMGRMMNGDPLVAIGNAKGQVVEGCKLLDPRGAAAVHIREGDDLVCSEARVENNHIGPSGEEWVEEIDGPEPELSPLGTPFGDGIRVACRDSVIRSNVITDITGIGIVTFAPGTKISQNQITIRGHTSVGGIFLVSRDPFGGNYTGTVVQRNTIDASGPEAYMRVGIGAGAPIFTDDHKSVLYNASIIGNTVTGDRFGYGIAMAGVLGFVVDENVSKGAYWGVVSDRCARDPLNHVPTAFLYDPESSFGSFQKDFMPGVISFLTCIDSRERRVIILKAGPNPPNKNQEHEDVAQMKPTIWEIMLKHSEDRIARMILDITGKLPTDPRPMSTEFGYHTSGDIIGASKQFTGQWKIIEDVSERVTALAEEEELIRQMVTSLELSVESFRQNPVFQTSTSWEKIDLTSATESNTLLRVLIGVQMLIIFALLFSRRTRGSKHVRDASKTAISDKKR
ncbi:hypothetical protein FRB95_008679 [Tulasnella sp. JGI-2019a]|nr:hypothetical protein FRB95_008679 [Tulasnella sp. JGI-2019a]